MGLYPAAVALQHTNTHITYTSNTHVAQNNTTKKNKSAHKATQTMEGILQAMNTGLGGLLSSERSRLPHCLDNRFKLEVRLPVAFNPPRSIFRKTFWYSLIMLIITEVGLEQLLQGVRTWFKFSLLWMLRVLSLGDEGTAFGGTYTDVSKESTAANFRSNWT
jgi:hypothetical protein